MRRGLTAAISVVLACGLALMAWLLVARSGQQAVASGNADPSSPPTLAQAGPSSSPTAATADASASEGRSSDVSATRIMLTPTEDPATSQSITWSSSAGGAQRVVIREASGGPATEWPGRRGLSPTVQFSGTDVPRFGVTLTGLRPATRYAYRIASDAGWTDERTFTTAEKEMPAEGWTFLALGDTQLENSTTVKQIVDQAVTETPEAALMVQVGDVVNEPYDDAQWRDMFQAMGMTAGSRNWLVSIGNHEQCVLIDCDSNGAEAFRSYFDWPDNGYPEQGETWFFTDYQGVRFVVLDSFGGQIVEQADFLEEALRTNPGDWSVVVQHTPAFSARPDRTNMEIRDLWVPIVERYDVDLVLTGHDHSYARGFLNVDGDGPMYVVSVSGPKFYPVTQRDWIRNGATRVVSAARTPTYQVITVDDRSLSYQAVVAGTDTLVPEGREAGEILDEFVLIKQADGSKKVRDSATSDQ